MMSLSEQKTSRNSSFNHSMMPSVKSKLIKNFGRTKEKIMQGMGKSDRTSDHSFDAYVHNFEAHHAQATKLNKELNKYLSSLRDTQRSSKAFYDTLRETYEAEYNRLLDFDSARHTLQSAEHKTSKKLGQSVHSTMKNASAGSSSSASSTASANHAAASHATTDQLTKLTKLKIELEDKQHVYEDLNQTLCLALPVLYQNRIKFYSSMFQTFFHTETTFHSDCVEAKSKLDDVCEKLSLETGQMRPDETALPPMDTQPAQANDYSTHDHESEHSAIATSITEFAPNLDSEPVGVRPVEPSASVIYSYLVDGISEGSQD
ncbi:myc box-dependent-interacting 1 isoform X4, partial [Brachionus plicatilis]